MKTMSKRFASLFLAILCIISLFPTTAFAADATIYDSKSLSSEEIQTENITPDMITYGNEDGWPILAETGEAINFESKGSLHWNDWRWTYYTSNIKYTYHYKTKEWYPCDDGIYRTEDGYIVLASQHHDKGTILDTPFGKGIVLDWCGTEGTIDIYTHYLDPND